ncbi:GNAT family N-acetyltransferase [uncultured Ruminococcus sp.]|uniref:GNAT family N-acetyltransferase n=1 Tax=uncultured Ruminococcus sp. TaxID=165186 RepID=UPI0025E6A705|nr:GNAT family N-acetyltransferase [uncultured Ruminococcus sp.]
MGIIKASAGDFEFVKSITQDTINGIYPKYYPSGAVQFFLQHHSDENIRDDIENGRTFLYVDDERNRIGTVSIKENDIGRLFVLPEYQGQGYGGELLAFAEDIISRTYDEIILDSSLAAKSIYLNRGYREIAFNKVKTDNGDYLCWDIMSKKVKGK